MKDDPTTQDQVCRANLDADAPEQKDNLYAQAGEAWRRLKVSANAAWDDYLIIGEAMITARTDLLHKLQINKPHGSNYQKRWKEWLLAHGLADMHKTTRSLLIELIEHRGEVEEMRSGWSDAERARRNSPNTTAHAWKKWRAKHGQPSKTPKQTNAQPTRQQLAKTVEHLQAHVAELEAAREVPPPAGRPDFLFDVNDDGHARLINADDHADCDFLSTMQGLFETNDHVLVVCESNGTIWTFNFARNERHNGHEAKHEAAVKHNTRAGR
jgi:hypothetical protein